ncbi:SDR family oxidoreductase [bacterium]|nr:SDR family oxidoreductase [bacterium]
MALYLVTGGAGFIGSNIVEELVLRGERVRVFDNFSTGTQANLARFGGRIEVINGDIRVLDALRAAVAGAEYVLHQAALPSVPRSIEDPVTANEVNITGTLNVLVAARDAKVKRVVFAASSSAYGNIAVSPKREDLPAMPASPYAIGKLAGEYYCQVFHQVYGLETVALRYFNVFGPRQDPQSLYAAVIPKFITALMKKEAPTIYGDGAQTRDFTYVANVVSANLLACTARGAAGRVFNVACGESVSLLDLFGQIARLLAADVTPVFAAERPGDVKHSLADITAARTVLGYTPLVPFAEGMARTVEYFRTLPS